MLIDVRDRMRCYVVANRSEAVFFFESNEVKFRFLDQLKNPRGKLVERELDSDRPGRGVSSAGEGTIRHSLDKTFKRHETVAKQFAHSITDYLVKLARKAGLNELVLVAEPRFLGILRASLPASLRKIVKHELKSEFPRGSERELKQKIRRAVDASSY